MAGRASLARLRGPGGLLPGGVFAAGFRGPPHPAVLLWLAAPISPILAMVAAAGIARQASLPVPTRRFWRSLAVSCVLISTGAALNAWDALRTGTQVLSTPTAAVYGGSILVLLWGLLRLPLGAADWSERLRIAMDGGTVLLAGAMFLWHFQARPMLVSSGGATGTVLLNVVVLACELVAIFAVAKAALSGQAFIAGGSLRIFVFGLLGAAVGGIGQRFVGDRPWLNTPEIAIPIALICVPVAADLQRRWAGRPSGSRSRPFSSLPYLAIAVVDALLVDCILTRSPDMLPAALAAVGLAALVVSRQLAAFRENGRLLRRLDYGATHDSLTRLPNRALFNDRLAAAVDDGRPVSVALIDLDDFKIVNDTLGHSAGDTLLVAVARRLSAAVRPTDTVARLGGDEFVVILDDCAPAMAEEIIGRMIAALADPVVADGHDLFVRAGIGVTTSQDGGTPEDLLRRADIAMYAAKNSGGSGFLMFSPEMAAQPVA